MTRNDRRFAPGATMLFVLGVSLAFWAIVIVGVIVAIHRH